MKEHRISCPRFGGQRLATACCTSDRYRFCRKKCWALKKHLELFPDLPKIAAQANKVRPTFEKSLYANKGLPVITEWQCKVCGFNAISERGLKSHMTRSHGERRR